MTIILNGYLIVCAVAFALCWLGMMACILVVIVEAIRSAGSLGPSFAVLFVAQSRSGQLPSRSQRAVQLAGRFRDWAFRAWCAAVAGVAGYVRSAVRKLGVDFLRHHNHFAGNVLVRILVARKISLDVAEAAFHAQRLFEGAHGGHQILGLKKLQVLRRGMFVVGGLWRLLSHQWCEHCQGNQ